MINYYGSIKIKNPKTLQKWINNGWYQKLIEEGYTFAKGCGRFRIGKCECSKCRKVIKTELKNIINL